MNTTFLHLTDLHIVHTNDPEPGTAPVAASATTCKFLVTPAPRSLRLFSERSSTSAGNTPPTAGASASYPSSSSTL